MAFGLLNNRVTGITASSVSAFGYVVTVYRQGAVVNGNQSSLTGTQKVNIVDTGAIRPGDTVKKAAAGTGYTVMSVVESGSAPTRRPTSDAAPATGTRRASQP